MGGGVLRGHWSWSRDPEGWETPLSRCLLGCPQNEDAQRAPHGCCYKCPLAVERFTFRFQLAAHRAEKGKQRLREMPWVHVTLVGCSSFFAGIGRPKGTKRTALEKTSVDKRIHGEEIVLA